MGNKTCVLFVWLISPRPQRQFITLVPGPKHIYIYICVCVYMGAGGQLMEFSQMFRKGQPTKVSTRKISSGEIGVALCVVVSWSLSNLSAFTLNFLQSFLSSDAVCLAAANLAASLFFFISENRHMELSCRAMLMKDSNSKCLMFIWNPYPYHVWWPWGARSTKHAV